MIKPKIHNKLNKKQRVKLNKKKQNLNNKLMPWSYEKRDTVQNSIPFEFMYDNGIAYLGNNFYSASYYFSDVNYSNISEDNKVITFEKYCYFLNSFDETVSVQIHIINKYIDRNNQDLLLSKNIKTIDENTNEYIENYNDMINEKLYSKSSCINDRYITITINANNIETALAKFDRINDTSFTELKKVGSKTIQMLDKLQRLMLLKKIYKPDDNLESTYEQMADSGIYDKDLIAPYSIDNSDEQYFKLGEYYTKTLFLTQFPSELSDEIIKEILSTNANLFLTINIQPQNSIEAIKKTETKLAKLDAQEFQSHDKQTKLGALIPKTPRKLERALTNAEDFLKDLQNRDEKMFLTNILIVIQDKNKDNLQLTEELIKSNIAKLSCELGYLTFDHENGFNSALPLGRNDTFIKRTLTTSSLAVFMPFNVIELIHKNGLYYGQNKLSKNVIKLDRKSMANPNGFICGVSGSGKSMGAKAEIWECFWRYINDDILIIDPDGEVRHEVA